MHRILSTLTNPRIARARHLTNFFGLAAACAVVCAFLMGVA